MQTIAISLFRASLYRRLSISNIQHGKPYLCQSKYKVANLHYSSYEDSDDSLDLSHIQVKSSKIPQYWIDQLKLIQKPSARELIAQLTPENALGYQKPTGEEIKSGSMVKQAIDEKEKHPDKIILFRCGDFYETYGIDAIILVAYCGLNPMGNKCRAGCPVKNVQGTLDRLTEVGLSAAVYEEFEEINVNRGPTKRTKLKNRALQQIVTPSFSTYTYDRCLQVDDIDFRPNRPILGIFSSNNGYTLCEIHVDERNIILSERLTEESVQSILEISGCIEPIYISQEINIDKNLCFLQDYQLQKLALGPPSRDSILSSNLLLRHISREMALDVSLFRHSTRDYSNRPRPVYKSTALQIGLVKNENVPRLIPFILTRSSYAYAQRFLYQWILNPPSQALCNHMRILCTSLESLKIPLIRCHPILEGKVVSLILAKECNPSLFLEISSNVKSVRDILSLGYQFNSPSVATSPTEEAKPTDHPYSSFLPSLLAITSSQSGYYLSVERLYVMCNQILQLIENVIATANDFEAGGDYDVSVDPFHRIPTSFFEQNEQLIRRIVKSTASEAIQRYYHELRAASQELCRIVNKEFPKENDVMFDVFSNQLFIKNIGSLNALGILSIDHRLLRNHSSTAVDNDIKFIELPDDKSSKKSKKNRFSTINVEKALSKYLSCVEYGPKVITLELRTLCDKLSGQYLQAITHSCHFAIILQTISSHVASSKQKGWNMPQIVEFAVNNGNSPSDDEVNSIKGPNLELVDFTPYWMDRATAVHNTLTFNGMVLLTAPNMSGKSTLMRSVLVIALLANCGLFTPCSSRSKIPQFDCFFLRTASYDIPSEDKSAFAVEMDDVRVVLRDATAKSLVMMDEIGKGTSSRDGSAIAGALLEYLSEKNVYTIFATHLHELLSLPLKLNHNRFSCKRMGFRLDDQTGKVVWTYQLSDGVCLDSMALHTARAYGISNQILNRASELGSYFDNNLRGQSFQVFDDTETTAKTSKSPKLNGGLNESRNTIDGRKSRKLSYRNKTDESKSPSSDLLVPSSDSLPDDRIGRQKYSLVDLIPIMNQYVDAKATPLIVDEFQDPPLSMEGQSCVYILHLMPRSKKGADRFYVGETESIQQRLYQHRSKRKDTIIQAMIIAASSKSTARMIETSIQQTLIREGYEIESDKDARHVLFGSAFSQDDRNHS